jgi:hypothetical protein
MLDETEIAYKKFKIAIFSSNISTYVCIYKLDNRQRMSKLL